MQLFVLLFNWTKGLFSLEERKVSTVMLVFIMFSGVATYVFYKDHTIPMSAVWVILGLATCITGVNVFNPSMMGSQNMYGGYNNYGNYDSHGMYNNSYNYETGIHTNTNMPITSKDSTNININQSANEPTNCNNGV